MLLFLAFTYFSLCTFDSWITRKRLIHYGPQVEGNEVIRNLSTKMGPEVATYVGIILPSILITLVLVALNWPIASFQDLSDTELECLLISFRSSVRERST